MNKRGRGQVNAFNLVPVVEHVLPDRPRAEVLCVHHSPSRCFFWKKILNRAHFRSPPPPLPPCRWSVSPLLIDLSTLELQMGIYTVLEVHPLQYFQCISCILFSLLPLPPCLTSLIVYYQLEENLSPLGKTIYQSKVKGQIQLGGDKVCLSY